MYNLLDNPKSVRQVTSYLKSSGYPEYELVRGEGYFYFYGGDSFRFDTASVPVYNIGDLTYGEWLDDLKGKIEDYKLNKMEESSMKSSVSKILAGESVRKIIMTESSRSSDELFNKLRSASKDYGDFVGGDYGVVDDQFRSDFVEEEYDDPAWVRKSRKRLRNAIKDGDIYTMSQKETSTRKYNKLKSEIYDKLFADEGYENVFSETLGRNRKLNIWRKK